MAVYYLDASAVVKYYVPKPGSFWVRQLLDAQDPVSAQALHIILVAEVARVEVAAGLASIERVGRIRRAARIREYQRFTSNLIHRYAILPVTTADFVAAADLTQRHPLKAYDAVQLAVALRYGLILSGHPFTFVSGDGTLLAAAHTDVVRYQHAYRIQSQCHEQRDELVNAWANRDTAKRAERRCALTERQAGSLPQQMGTRGVRKVFWSR
ncbi:MAG TPA: type II toxin-antitoxin system VapC family toxin [Candidatus Tectomicrobia bacterium]|jgi:predicted nucleic acid-binding protein